MLIMAADVTDISKLAQVVHQNGDKVLNALSKLSLNATLLQKLNKEFETLQPSGNYDENSSFEVLSTHHSNSKFIKDLEFLHDFLQKTVGLKLVNHVNLSLNNSKIDLSKFKNLKYLELKKIPIKELVGLKMIQSQLESIVCMRCLSSLEELLAECGGDNSIGFVWSELKEAILSYNNITIVDTSIAFAPWLQVLDLSHNQISNVKAIECLPNLKYINLSFNCLNVIPTFSRSARKKLQILVMKNNYVEDLSGLVGLDYLTELDLSCNWISNCEVLDPMLAMSALQCLSLRGNPISFHSSYRKNVVGYLHISASFGNFMFDKGKLSKQEKGIVGIKLCERSRASGSPTRRLTRLPTAGEPEAKGDGEKARKKGGKVRLAVIPNLDDGTYEELSASSSTLNLVGASTEHLITKKRLENTRATFGSDNWLRCQAGSVVQDILGLPPTPAGLSSTPFDELCLAAAMASAGHLVTTQAVIEPRPAPRPEPRSEPRPDQSSSDLFLSCLEDNTSGYHSVETSAEKIDLQEEVPAVSSKETSPDIEPIQDSEEEEEDLQAGDNEKPYVVLREVKTFNNETRLEELFLTVSDLEVKEKDLSQGKVVTKWSLDSLESCVRVKPAVLHLCFDTLRRDKKERVYEMDPGEAGEVHKRLGAMLDARSLTDMNQVAYRCVKCSTHFSVEKNARKPGNASKCPSCLSKLIIEADDVPLPSSAQTPRKRSDVTRPEGKVGRSNHNRSSSTGGALQTFPAAPGMVQSSSQSSIDCSTSPNTDYSKKSSAASLDELNELPAIPSCAVKRCDSDIEILSNPSQSSIEVIDGPMRMGGSTPRRKRSSEERHSVVTVATAGSVAPQAPAERSAGLTESSSSGSVTDSVCTAYETNSMANSGVSKKSGQSTDVAPIIEEVAASNVAEVVLTPLPPRHFQQMLQEAIENQGSSPQRRRSRPEGRAADAVQYSYTDLGCVDHRIKLLLYTTVFEDGEEDLVFLVRCDILQRALDLPYPACLAGSNKKLYVLKVTGKEEGDEAFRFLQKVDSLTTAVSCVKCIYTLSWHQGLGLRLREAGDRTAELLVLLKDEVRTRNLLKWLTSSEVRWSNDCKIVHDCLQRPYLAVQHLLLSGTSEDSSIQFFSLFCRCSVVDDPDTKRIVSGAVLTTNTDLLLFSEQLQWLFDSADQCPSLKYSQKLSNLMQVEMDEERVILHFLNELEGKEELWCLRMATPQVVQGLITALRAPWEDMFSVPLQVSPLPVPQLYQ